MLSGLREREIRLAPLPVDHTKKKQKKSTLRAVCCTDSLFPPPQPHTRGQFSTILIFILFPLLSANTLVFSKATLVSPWCRPERAANYVDTFARLNRHCGFAIFLSRKSEARRRTVTCNRK